MAEKFKVTRADVDAFSIESHRRAAAAARDHRNKELLPTAGLDGAGNTVTLTRDEGIREVIDSAKIASLPTVFRPDGNGVVHRG